MRTSLRQRGPSVYVLTSPAGAAVPRVPNRSHQTNVPDYMIRNGQTLRIFSDDLGTPPVVVNGRRRGTAEGAITNYREGGYPCP